jgi:hypothetical protein
MQVSRAALAAVLALGTAGAAGAQTRQYSVTITPAGSQPAKGYQKLSISKATIGAAPIQLWANTAIDPDCTEHQPGATLSVLEPPAHDTATVSNEPLYMAFPPNNPRSKCNDRKIPGHQAIYVAQAGYRGHDQVVLQGTSPGGGVRQITVKIDVR